MSEMYNKLTRQPDGRYTLRIPGTEIDFCFINADVLPAANANDPVLWRFNLACFAEGDDSYYLSEDGKVVYSDHYYSEIYTNHIPTTIKELLELAATIKSCVVSTCDEQIASLGYIKDQLNDQSTLAN